MEKQETEIKQKLEMETETRKWKQKWKCNFFAAVVLARFNPSALPGSRFYFASLASLASFPDLLRCPSCSVVCDCLVFLTWLCKSLFMFSAILYLWCSVPSWFCINMPCTWDECEFLDWQVFGVGMGLLYPGPGYEVIICFTHCKQSKLQVGLGMMLQE